MTIIKKLFVTLALLLFCTILNAQTNVSIQLKWKHQFQFAGFYMAKELGFYKDVGIDLDIQEYQGGIIVDDILEDKFTFGVDDSQLIYHRLKGSNIVGLIATFQDSPLAMMTTKRIKTLKDLENQEIQFSKNALHNIAMQAMLLSNDVKIKPVDLKNKVQYLLDGKVQAISGYLSNELFALKNNDIDYNIFHPRDYGFNFYGDILFTKEEFAKSNPQLIYNFIEATNKGWQYVFENIDETIDVILEKYNTQNKSKEWLLYESDVLKDFSGYKDGSFGLLKKDKINEIGKVISIILPNLYDIDNLNSFTFDYKKELIAYYKNNHFKTNNKYKVCVNPDLMPLDGILENKVTGISGDILKIIEDELKITFIPIKSNSRDTLRAKLANKECDLLSISTKLGNHLDMVFSKYFIKGHFAVITKYDTPFMENSDKIIENKKYITRYNSAATYLKKLYPTLNIVFEEDITKALEILENKKVDGYVVDYISADKIIEEFDFKKYKISGFLAQENPIEGGFSVHKDQKELLDAINIILDSIDEKELTHIIDRWRVAKYITTGVDYEFVKRVVMGFIVILFILFSVLLILRHNNKNLKKQIQQEIEKNTHQQVIMFHQERLAQMGQMLSMIAHQWRQPLNQLSLMIGSVYIKHQKNKLDEATIKELKNEFTNKLSYMSQTINDFQNFFKPNKEKETFYIKQTIVDTISLINNLLLNKQILVNIDIDDSLFLNGYKNELAQVVLNIITNAKDAFEESEIKEKIINIEAYKQSNQLYIIISDNAGGIDEAIKEKIFDPYFSTKKSKHGTGLGLYMCKVILNDHFNGDIKASNIPNGTKFIITAKIP